MKNLMLLSDIFRLELLNTIRLGGIYNLEVHNQDLTCLSFEDDSFEVVTILEVLEHIKEVKQAIKEAGYNNAYVEYENKSIKRK
jgi:hypothetical protein